MDSSVLGRYQDEIAYLRSLLESNGIPYDFTSYLEKQKLADRKVVELEPLDISVIDESIAWYGSVNFLSREREEDNLMRIESQSVAQELLLRYAQAKN